MFKLTINVCIYRNERKDIKGELFSKYNVIYLQQIKWNLANFDICTGLVLDAFENKSIVLRFDKNHLTDKIFLDKLYNYGVRGVSYGWFQSYLSDRRHIVNVLLN